jgi:protease-4
VAKKPSLISRVLKFVWRLVGLAYGLFMLLSLILIPVAMYFILSGGPRVTVEENVALVWVPIGNLTEQRDSPVSNVVLDRLLPSNNRVTEVHGLIQSLDEAADDARISLAFLKLDQLTGATAGQLQDLAMAIQRFREAGKKVVAWAPGYSQAQYYLAAQADEIYLDPLGFVFLEGYSVYRQYFRDAIEKLEVDVNIFRVGEYKSFVEPFTRNDMSPEARAANRAWLESVWTTYKDTAGQARGLSGEDIEGYISNFSQNMQRYGGNAAEVALKGGLVDEVLPLEALRNKMRSLVGTDEEHGSFRQISHFDYLRAARATAPEPRTDSKVAMVVVEGAIIDGESARGSAGGDTIARLLADVRRDDDVSALLLRVNSPGGSLFASETIRREIELLHDAGKPVVVSMAGVAASGGYWISMNADEIWAQPNTITGSIGVFGVVPGFSKPLSNLGINTDGIGTTELSGALRPDRPMSPEAKRILQSGIEHAYREFINKIADARDMGVDAVDRVAQGRVWSGLDAERIGLVDKIGGLDQAVQAAARLAGLQEGDYELETRQGLRDWRATLMDFLSLQLRERLAGTLLPEWASEVPIDGSLRWLLQDLNDPRGMYAHCLCETASTSGITPGALSP